MIVLKVVWFVHIHMGTLVAFVRSVDKLHKLSFLRVTEKRKNLSFAFLFLLLSIGSFWCDIIMRNSAGPVPLYSLREFKVDDSAELAGRLNNPNISRFLTRVPEPYDESDAREYISDLIADSKRPNPTKYQRAIVHDNELVGCVGLDIDIKQRTGALGYWLAEEMWGHGIMTHAARSIIDTGFSTLKLKRINAVTNIDNLGSQKVLNKLGFKYVGEGTTQRWNDEAMPIYKYELDNPK